MRNIFSKLDKPLLFTTILLCGIGLLMVFSSSSIVAILRYGKAPTYFFIKQVIFFAISFIVGFVILKIPTKLYQSLSWVLILIIIGLLALLLVYGSITNHAQSWFYIPVVNFAFQPSEFAKSFLILFMASFYSYLARIKAKNVYLFFIPLGVAFVIGVLILMQPDFGSALILLGISFCIFISVPMIKGNIRKIMTIGASILIVLGVALLYSGTEILNSEQMSRFTFREPCQRYKEKTGYQVCNGFIAINNGGLTGVGIGNSTQKYSYLPESHTDFIFAILVEELGLIVALFVLLLYVYMLYRILKIAKETHTLRNSIIAYGVFWMFTFHILINLSGMLALLPLTGVPLPLMSYGGSSTINFVLMLFIVQRVAIEKNNKKQENYQIEAEI